MEQVRAEQKLYSGAVVLADGGRRRPLEELVPVQRARAVVEQRRAQLHLASKRLEHVEGRRQEIATLEKAHEKLLQDRDLLRRRLERTAIAAPAAGTVLTGELERRIGDRVQAGQSLLELAEMNGWQARVEVSETDWPQVEVGQEVRLYVEAFPHM